jgi:hypothetical protein
MRHVQRGVQRRMEHMQMRCIEDMVPVLLVLHVRMGAKL